MDCRIKHSVEVRKKAAEFFASGMDLVQSQVTLSVPRQTVKEWHHIPRVWKRGATDHGWQASSTPTNKRLLQQELSLRAA